MKPVILLAVALLSGCTTQGDDARSLLDRLEFDKGECGTFELTGNVDVGPPIPGFGSTLHAKLEKQKPCPPEPVNVADPEA